MNTITMTRGSREKMILRLCIDFQLCSNPVPGKKVCGGGWVGGGVLMRV